MKKSKSDLSKEWTELFKAKDARADVLELEEKRRTIQLQAAYATLILDSLAEKCVFLRTKLIPHLEAASEKAAKKALSDYRTQLAVLTGAIGDSAVDREILHLAEIDCDTKLAKIYNGASNMVASSSN